MSNILLNKLHKKYAHNPPPFITNRSANIVIEADDIIDKEFPHEKYMLGMCHAIWHRTKELYAERGYTWHSPQDMHPLWTFD